MFETPANRDALAVFINKISQGKQVYVIKNIPVDPEVLPPDSLIKRHYSMEGGKVEIINRTSPMAAYTAEFGSINIALQQIATATNAKQISPTDYWCASGSCPSLDSNGFPLYLDNGHITATYSRRAAIFIDQTLKPSKKAKGIEVDCPLMN